MINYKSELIKINTISSKLINEKNLKIDDIKNIHKIVTNIIEEEDNKKRIIELKKNFNSKIKLWKILDYVDKIEIDDSQLGQTTYWKKYVKIKHFYFCQEFFGNFDSSDDKYLYFGESGNDESNKFSFYYIENGSGNIMDCTLKKKILLFINKIQNYFQLDEPINPVDFLFFVLIMVSNNLNLNY